MTRDEVKEVFVAELNETIKEDIQAEDLDEETTIESLGADSLDISELIVSLEESLDIEIDDDELLSKETVGEVIDYLLSLKVQSL